jgi:hypothetical protein
MVDRRHDGENNCNCKRNRKRCEDKTRDHDALPYSNNDLLIILPAFLLIPAEIRPVQDVKAPFDHFNDGNSYGDSESKKQNELDDHFCDT